MSRKLNRKLSDRLGYIWFPKIGEKFQVTGNRKLREYGICHYFPIGELVTCSEVGKYSLPAAEFKDSTGMRQIIEKRHVRRAKVKENKND